MFAALLMLAPPAIDRADPATWPPELDAVVAAPDHHKVLLENDEVRVLEVVLPPATTERVHAHRWPAVIQIQAGGDFIDRDHTGRILYDSRKTKNRPKLPLTLYAPPEPPHAVENLSRTETMRLLRVELKRR